MDIEETRGFNEPCPICSDVNWGISDEDKFYCRSCHTAIEKTKEADQLDIFIANAKVKSISKELKIKKPEKGWEWRVCEGFQFVLLKQAEALQALGVDPKIKDEVLCYFWRRYLQKTGQAYLDKQATGRSSSADSSDSDSRADLLSTAYSSESDRESLAISGFSSKGDTSASEISDSAKSIVSSSAYSASTDGAFFKKKTHWEKRISMSMPKTLAFCYLSLLWLRVPLTLSDLLRLVFNHHVPYFNPEQYFPEKIKLFGEDVHIFQVLDYPKHRRIMEMTRDLGLLLKLPCFPPVTETCFYHPNVLCMKYLMEVNLPDELHNWTNLVARKTGLDDTTTLTYNPICKYRRFIPYDIQAAAIIIVVLKLLFALNDQWEWEISEIARERNENSEVPVFDFAKWYETISPCVEEGKQKQSEKRARFNWKSDKALSYSQGSKCRAIKKNRIKHNLQRQFSRLVGAAPDAGNPTSFLFNWEEQNTSKISFHGHSLEGITQLGNSALSRLKTHYWFSSKKKCTSKYCKHWNLYDKSNFPATYDFVLSLFCLVLGVEACHIHYEVGLVEGKLFKDFLKEKPKKKKQKSKT